ncbi:MAG: S1C family serine protease [Acetivibrionales bacterium]
MYREKRRGNILRTLLTVLLSALGTAVLVIMLLSGYITKNAPTPQTPNTPQSQDPIDIPQPQLIATESVQGEPIAAAVARTAAPGVVGISVLKVDSSSIFDGDAAEKWGVGSGVIVSPDGYILTNHHVAGGKNRRIIVSLEDGRNVDGQTLWSEPVIDLAVVKVNLNGLAPIPLGDSDKLVVGEPAIAIGNPLGLEFQRTVTSGIVSALNRTIKIDTEQGPNYMEDLIQTDASINPGNSGGPLINSKGEVIGINTVKVASAEAIGFAIPINVAKPIIEKYINYGDFEEPYLGVFAYDKAVIPYIDGNIKVDNGIYIVNVDEKGPACGCGIHEGCIISEVDGVKINTMMQLRSYIYSKNPGDTINVTHLSKETNKFVTVPIKLAAKEKDGMVTR